jgi:molybdenum cofactor synthesis domain-containing protein
MTVSGIGGLVACRGRYAAVMPTSPTQRQLLTAEILSIGSELTVGETRDTNGGELARGLSLEGVTIGRITAVPDRLDVVTAAFRSAIDRADLVVSTGGLGPTPDDLTRESIAAAFGETPVGDPEIETWLRGRWERRGLPFPEINLKQAWVIPSCEPLPNPNGSAPGWFVTRPDGRVVVAMPGPPREMRPMWENEVLPRLVARGLGRDLAVRTFRLTGIGESQVAEILGEDMLRRPDPEVTTYARLEAVDVRVSSSASGGGGADQGHRGSAQARVDEAAAIVLARLGEYVWAEGDTTWSTAIGDQLGARGWRIGIDEIGTGGQVAALFGNVDWLAIAETRPLSTSTDDADEGGLMERAQRVRSNGGVEVGLAVRARPRGSELAVSVAIITPGGERRHTRSTYTGGSLGRSQAALVAAATLSAALREA